MGDSLDFSNLTLQEYIALKKNGRKPTTEGSLGEKPSTAVINNHQSALNLQILKHRDEILNKINQNRVTIISAVTGSGKTTQVPQFILDDSAKHNRNCRILVSQPRKIAAITVAKRVTTERDSELGDEVCFQVGLHKKVNEEFNENRVTYCTTGVVLEKIIAAKSLHGFSHIILDEIHEREINMDLLVTIMRELLKSDDTNSRLVLMSATLDVTLFANYFAEFSPVIIKLGVDNRFKIEEFYLDQIRYSADVNYRQPGISASMYRVAKQLVAEQMVKNPKAILVFLPGISQIEAMHTMLAEDSELMESCQVCLLHSSLSVREQRNAFTLATKPKIILATNIAESSVTISDVSCVIDFCLTKNIVTNKDSSLSSLQLAWAAKDSLKQRRGRTGRTCDGVVFRLITEEMFKMNISKYTTPEIQRSPLEKVVLQIKLLDYESPTQLLMKAMDPPENDAISTAVLVLKEVGGLERMNSQGNYVDGDGKLTYVGQIMAGLPLDVRVSKLIVLGYVFSVLDDAIIIAAGLTIKSIFRQSFHEKLDDYKKKLRWAGGSGSDLMAILNAYTQWKHQKEQSAFRNNKNAEQIWCEKRNLEVKNLYEMRTLIDEINSRLAKLEMQSLAGNYAVKWDAKETSFILKLCFAGAFIPNFFIAGESNEINEIDIFKEVCNRDPHNTLMFRKFNNEQVGEVYEDQIKKKILAMGIGKEEADMKISFERGSSKFFVEFVGSDSMIDDESGNFISSPVLGKISAEVYHGIKSRRLNNRLVLNVMPARDTAEYAKDYGIGDVESGIVSRFKSKPVMKHPDYCMIPLTKEHKVLGVITHIDHCGKFYVFPKYDFQDKLMEYIRSLLDEDDWPVSHVKEGQLIGIDFEGFLHRAKVVSKPGPNEVESFLFDSGRTVTVPLETVRNAAKKCFEYSERCFLARLAEIEPSALKCPNGKWTKSAIEKFHSLTDGKELVVEVYSVVNRVASVKLWIDDNCINDILMAEGFAQEAEELFPSKLDHELRTRIQKNESLQFEEDVEFKDFANEMLVPVIPPPPPKKCTERMFLVGPSSPMEATVSHCLIQSECFSVTVDPGSVNSIVLYDDPSNKYGRLIIAADVMKSGSQLTIRETTMMPDIKGLPMLLAMLFSPDIAFFRNESKTDYVRFMFGLGSVGEQLSMFPEHDCVLPVQFKVNHEDFSDINFVRFSMSRLLATEPTQITPFLTDEKKFEVMNDIKKTLKKIFSKVREPTAISLESNGNETWKVNYAEDVQKTRNVFQGFFYQHIVEPLLNETKPQKEVEKLIRAVENLELEYKSPTLGRTDAKKSYRCPICYRDVEGTSSLEIHFSSKIHKVQMKKLMEMKQQIEGKEEN